MGEWFISGLRYGYPDVQVRRADTSRWCAHLTASRTGRLSRTSSCQRVLVSERHKGSQLYCMESHDTREHTTHPTRTAPRDTRRRDTHTGVGGHGSRGARDTLEVRRYGAGEERTRSKTKGTATSPHSGPALVGSQYFNLWHLKNVKTKFRKKI